MLGRLEWRVGAEAGSRASEPSALSLSRSSAGRSVALTSRSVCLVTSIDKPAEPNRGKRDRLGRRPPVGQALVCGRQHEPAVTSPSSLSRRPGNAKLHLYTYTLAAHQPRQTLRPTRQPELPSPSSPPHHPFPSGDPSTPRFPPGRGPSRTLTHVQLVPAHDRVARPAPLAVAWSLETSQGTPLLHRRPS